MDGEQTEGLDSTRKEEARSKAQNGVMSFPIGKSGGKDIGTMTPKVITSPGRKEKNFI